MPTREKKFTKGDSVTVSEDVWRAYKLPPSNLRVATITRVKFGDASPYTYDLRAKGVPMQAKEEDLEKFDYPPQFEDAFIVMSHIVHEMARDKGWWDNERELGTQIALMHSELSEALEAAREGDPDSKKIPGFSSIEEELADVVIRIMDTGQHMNLNIGAAIMAKVRHNHRRKKMHGGKKF